MSPLRITIVGAGAIGGWMGITLAAAGHDVSVLARGVTLEKLRVDAWALERGGAVIKARVRAAEDPADLGQQDLVVLAVKGPALQGVAARLAPLMGPHTVLLPAMNGIPWWFLLDGAGELPPSRLASIDPSGLIETSLPRDRVIGCVVHASVHVPTPGVVRHVGGNGLVVGEPLGGRSERVEAIVATLAQAGFDATVTHDVRQAIWFKLWGNMTINPVSAITGATADRVLDDPLVEAFVLSVMREAKAIGGRIGCAIDEEGPQRNAVTRRLGAFKTSMLQDVEAGRALEIDDLLGAPREIAGMLGMETPNLDTLFGLARLFARGRGLYPQEVPN